MITLDEAKQIVRCPEDYARKAVRNAAAMLLNAKEATQADIVVAAEFFINASAQGK